MILVFQIEQNFDDFSKFKIGRPFLRTEKNLLDKRPMGRGGSLDDISLQGLEYCRFLIIREYLIPEFNDFHQIMRT